MMPRCYLLAVCAGSSLDQQSNNVTLFNLVEQLNVPPGVPPPPGGVVPLEIHAYFLLAPHELPASFEVRFAMVAGSGLETLSEVFPHRVVTPRFRTRTAGLPVPPVVGQYELRVDTRPLGGPSWTRDRLFWPIAILEASPQPVVTH
jgi:hypothetical protein